MNNHWQRFAACQGRDTALWYRREKASQDEAIEICSRCLVRATCLAVALATREPFGIWGGLTESERRRLRRRRRPKAA